MQLSLVHDILKLYLPKTVLNIRTMNIGLSLLYDKY